MPAGFQLADLLGRRARRRGRRRRRAPRGPGARSAACTGRRSRGSTIGRGAAVMRAPPSTAARAAPPRRPPAGARGRPPANGATAASSGATSEPGACFNAIRSPTHIRTARRDEEERPERPRRTPVRRATARRAACAPKTARSASETLRMTKSAHHVGRRRRRRATARESGSPGARRGVARPRLEERVDARSPDRPGRASAGRRARRGGRRREGGARLAGETSRPDRL